MKHIISKGILILLCLLISIKYFTNGTIGTISLLVGIILSYYDYAIFPEHTSSNAKIADTKCISEKIYFVILIAFAIFALYVPAFAVFLPCAVYDCGRQIKNKILIIPNVFVMINIISFLVSGKYQLGITIFIVCLLSIYLAYLSEANASLKIKEREQRDASKENQLLIEERNKQIIANQDNAVYTATLQERNRIAREIHDNVGHMLTRSILQLGAIKAINKDEVLKEPLENLHETLGSAMTNIRTSVHDLHDDAVDLKSAINQLAADVQRLKATVDYDMGRFVPRDIKYSFITITKEAINNAEKYSNGDSILILLREHPGFYQLMISDNGKNTTIKDSGIGLKNMQERVANINGTIKISTDDGFKILVSVLKKQNN